MTAELLLAELRSLCDGAVTWEAGAAEADAERWQRAIVAIRTLKAEDVPNSLRDELQEAVRAAAAAIEAHQGRINGRLRDIRAGREALRGYGGLRAHREGQRIRTEV